MSKNYLLEIGTEEIPARYVKDSLIQLKTKFEDLLEEERINYEEIKVYSTPRRLTTIITGLDERQEDIEKEVRGPAKKISYDEEGNPTKALQGFMRGQGVDIDKVIIKDVKGVEYVFAHVSEKGKDIDLILQKNIPEIIKSIRFPESMRWGGKNLRFIRPIRWIVSLLDDEVLGFEFEGIKVSNETNGHRFLGNKNVEITDVNKYMEILKDNFVILDQNERKEIIEYGSERLAREKGGYVEEDEKLLDEVTNIVEYPTPIIGRIKDEYLKLPNDVIITPMKEHQRYFPVFDDEGELLPYFITVRNGDDKHADNVVRGNEKVLGARLEDAKFFFEADISEPLEAYVETLENITFQEKLGTMYDKTKRVQKLADKISTYLEVGTETKKNVDRAAYLSKADLSTQMVIEFTELQGKIGEEYAKISGENDIVSQAIFEQYLPRFSGDDLPTTTAGAILSIADKLDSIAGLFAIDIHPTGSQDPFGLRRNAISIINIIVDKRLQLSLGEFVDFALYIYVDDTGLAFDYNKVKEEIMDFFYGRTKNIFSDAGVRYDIIDAVLSAEIDDIYDLKLRAESLSAWLEGDVSQVLAAFNRVSTLAKNAETVEVNRELFNEYEEELYSKYLVVKDEAKDLIGDKKYGDALNSFASLRKPIDNFFDNVMVMVDDEELKNNRLALIKNIYDTMMEVCDLSKIVN